MPRGPRALGVVAGQGPFPHAHYLVTLFSWTPVAET